MDLEEKTPDASLFVFVGKERRAQDETQVFAHPPISHAKDAWRRFCKNRSAVVGLVLLLLSAVFCLISPLLTPYTLQDKESAYPNKYPYLPLFEHAGFWDGGRENDFTQDNYLYFYAIGQETGHSPILQVKKEYEKIQIIGGVEKRTKMFRLRIQTYKEVGVVNGINLSAADFQKLCDYQSQSGRQVLYPLVDTTKLHGFDLAEGGGNYWYAIDAKGKPQLDGNGELQPVYLSVPQGDAALQYAPYESLRVAGDDGTYVYGRANQSGYATRICYWEYYRYLHGRLPSYAFGTNTYGQDIFCALGKGAGFSLLLAVVVSALNLCIGVLYGAVEGYYGGGVDLAMERICDVLSGIPFTVTVTLFGYHLAAKVGVVVSFVFAFLATGWISTAALTRKQFYRFKNREYVMAARTLGASDWRIMRKHIFPSSIGTVITSAAMLIPSVIGVETTLTYLGIVNLSAAGTTSLGTLIELGKGCLDTAPHVVLFPALFLAMIMIAFNLLGNGLRDALNPSLRFTK